jgi:carboxymethylenebutenolidase
MGHEIRISASDGSGSFTGYLATPANGSGPASGAGDARCPGVIVIQEIFGVNTDVRAKVDAWAAQGYVALAPDLFWRQEADVQMNTLDDAEWKRAFGLYQAFDFDAGAADLQSGISLLRGMCNGKVGTVGFCLGGALAYLCAVKSDADANVGYYGVGIEAMLEGATKISKPLILHIATADTFVLPEAQATIHAALDTHSSVTLYDYAGQQHAFSRIGGVHYDKASATLAHQRTADLFAKALR